MRVISKVPTEQIKFKTDVLLDVSTEKDLAPDALKVLESLKDMPVSVNENLPWKNQKRVYDIKIKKIDTKSFTALLTLDGGIPLKRLVSGTNIEPSMSILLENVCKCTTFDFHKIVTSN